MNQVGEWRQSDSFILKVIRSPENDLRGLVQHARTGEKMPFHDLASLGEAIDALRRWIAREESPRRHG